MMEGRSGFSPLPVGNSLMPVMVARAAQVVVFCALCSLNCPSPRMASAEWSGSSGHARSMHLDFRTAALANIGMIVSRARGSS